MSAICGIFSKKGELDMRQADAVMKKLGKYSYDKKQVMSTTNYYSGCYLNCITPESLNEILPYQDGNSDYIINADAIIDNRTELILKLELAKTQEADTITDSILILEAYKKWGTKCVDHLVGSFVFAIWDTGKQELFLASDHVGDKLLYYYKSDNMFVYSTLLEPFFQLESIKRKLNDVYIADFLAINSVKSQMDPEITIYENIYQLPSATAMLIRKGSMEKWEYWRVKKTKEIKYQTDQEYEDAFRKLYREVVSSKIRCHKKIGISLSGGLDSASVACIAAEELKAKGEKLYSYTQVPIKEYKDYLPANKLADETEYVEEIIRFSGNIEPKYIASEGKNMYNVIDCLLDIYEQPYKIMENATWIKEITETAEADDIGVLLTGQVGNATVSWGNFNGYMQYLLKSFRLKTFLREIKAYTRLYHRSPFKEVISSVISLSFLGTKLLQRIHSKSRPNYMLSPINPEFYNEMRIDQRLSNYAVDNQFIIRRDSLAERRFLLEPSSFSHRAVFLNKMNLATGTEKRDPTGDKRIIEFCMNIPENQWVRDGKERRFIRCAMDGHMPDKVRENVTVRGRQAADIYQRILPCWDAIRKEMLTIGEHGLERRYLNIDLIKKLLKDYEQIDSRVEGGQGLRLLFRALIFTRFLRKFT